MSLIDVSHFNGNINWTKVSKDGHGITGAYIKVSQGQGFTDPKCRINANGARENGLKIGYYHFATLDNTSIITDASNEAYQFLSVVDNLPSPDLPLVLDIEAIDHKVQLQQKDVLQWINTFFSHLSDESKDYALYSYTPFLNDNLPSDHGLGGVKLWIAAYTNTTQPRLPIGWSNYWMWQYTDKGRVDGIGTYTDLDKMNT